MFSISSQRRNWMFKNEEELEKLRLEANTAYIEERRAYAEISDDKIFSYFLTAEEEKILFRHFQTIMKDFCRKFTPPMPPSVIGTAHQYFRRFFLNNSVMNYHPKHILGTCVYLACKVEEFNVSMQQFIGNVRGDRAKGEDIVLSNELLVMQQLKYHLTVHNPYRPVEGFLIDIKTRCLTAGDPERFRPDIKDFIEKTYFTDAYLLFSPSQIALAAIVCAASKSGADLDSYLTEILLSEAPDKVQHLSHILKSLWDMIQSIETPDRKVVREIEKKLEICRNQANNPDSQEYKRALEDSISLDDDEPVRKYAKISEEQQLRENILIKSESSSSRH